MEDKTIKKIVDLISNAREQFKVHLEPLRAEVNRIIVTKSTNTKEIQHLLDSIFSFTPLGLGEDLYIQLLEYYKTLDAEGAAFYWEFLDESYED